MKKSFVLWAVAASLFNAGFLILCPQVSSERLVIGSFVIDCGLIFFANSISEESK